MQPSANKMAYSEKLALELKLPMIRMVEGTGGGGSVKTLEIAGRTYVPANPGWQSVVDLLGEAPVIAASLGPLPVWAPCASSRRTSQ